MMKLHALDGRGRLASMALRKCVIVIGKRGGVASRRSASFVGRDPCKV